MVSCDQPGSKDLYKVGNFFSERRGCVKWCSLQQRLQIQCDNMRIPTIPPSTETSSLSEALRSSDVILDTIFGFSFKAPVRAPFDKVLRLIAESKLPIVSVDIPSGWDVEKGKLEGGLEPDVLVSLTAPKLGVKNYAGRHFLAGRFVPR